MAKRRGKRKGGRPAPTGGRVTPKGARPGERNLWALPPLAPVPESPEDELREALEDCLADDHPLAFLELISTMIWVGSNADDDVRRGAPQLQAREAELALVDALQSFGDPGLAALAVVARLATTATARDLALRRVAREPSRLPGWCSHLDAPSIGRAVVLTSTDDHGSSDEIAVSLRLGGHALSLLTLIDTTIEPVLVDAVVVPADVDEVVVSASGRPDEHLDLTAADARARINDALATSDRWRAAGETDTWPEQRPLAEWILGLLPDGGSGYPAPGKSWTDDLEAELGPAVSGLFGGFDPAEAAAAVAQALEAQVGGAQLLADLDDAPLPDEPFVWTGIADDIRSNVAEVLRECESFTAVHFDAELRTAARRLLSDIAVNGPVAFRRAGAAWSAAAGICLLVGEANGVVAGWSQDPAVLNASQVAGHWGRKGNIRSRGEALRRAAGIPERLPPRYLVSTERTKLIQLRDALPELADVLGGTSPAAGPAVAGGLERLQMTGPSVHVLKVTIQGSKPPIWRRLVVPSHATLADLHEILQVAFDWEGHHLHDFELGRQRFTSLGDLDEPSYGPPTIDEATVRLGELVGKDGRMLYTYDFGDNWEHRIVVEEVRPLDADTTHATCIGGRRAAPPDDIGGVWTFNDVVGGGPIDPELADWLPIGFDPVEFAVDDTSELLRDLPPIRASG